MNDTKLIVEPLDRRPDLAPMLWQISDIWPRFMQQDPSSTMYYDVVTERYSEFAMVAYEPDRPDVPIARSFAVPFAFGAEHGRHELPDDGWDAVIRWGWLDHAEGRTPTHASALEIGIAPDRRGEGLAAVMLAAMRDNVARLGFTDLFAPVRPSGKTHEPQVPMTEYAARTRPDGLPEDPWLRVHARAGAEIVGVCPRAMTISGTLAEWREWTGLPFDRTGDATVPFALNPVHVDVTHDHAVYVEPGVWVHHKIAMQPTA